MMRRKYIYPIAIMCGLLVLMFSCRKDDMITSIEDDIPPTLEYTESGVGGQVLDMKGNPLPNINVHVMANGVSIANTQTNVYGFFRMGNAALNEDGALLQFRGNGFYDNYKYVYPESNSQAWTSVFMVEKELTQQFRATEDVTIKIQDQAEIQFDANSIANADGTTYQGDVSLYAYWYNPNEATFLDQAPGDLRAENADGDQVQLVSYGMMAVEIFDNNGNELNIQQGNTAKLTFPLSLNSSQVPGEMPLWYFDEQEGIWLEEGTATNNGSALIAEVSHFSFWNCDVPFDLVSIKGKVSKSDVDLSKYRIEITSEGFGAGSTFTNSVGCFEGKVPKGVPLTLKIQARDICEDEFPVVYEEEYIFENDEDLGTIEVTTPQLEEYLIQTEIKDCQNNGVPFGYLKLDLGSKDLILQSDDNGKIEAFIYNCESLDNVTAQALDLDEGLQSVEVQVAFDQNNIAQLGELKVCNDSEYFLNISVNDSDDISMKNPKVFVLNDSYYYIHSYSYETNEFVSFVIDISSQPYKVLKIHITEGTAGNFSYADFCPHISYWPTTSNQCQRYEVKSLEHSAQSGEVIGSILFSEANDIVDISFHLKLEEEELNTTTLEVKVWIDENENGLQDSGEGFPATMEDRSTVLEATNDRFKNGFFRTDGDYDPSTGILSFVVLENEWIRLLSGFDLTMTSKDAGDDAIDNDFDPLTLRTDEFYVLDGAPIGLGLKSPDALNCSLENYNCASGSLKLNVTGGEGPFYYLWEPNFETSQSISLAQPGLYSCTVTDANGKTCSQSIDVAANMTRVYGFVFVDEDGGVDNVYDQGIDTKLEGVEFSVISDDITFSSDADGNFEVSNLRMHPATRSVILTGDISGYELVEPNATTDESLDSDIDPNCKNCHYFLLDECDSEVEITVGLRRI